MDLGVCQSLKNVHLGVQHYGIRAAVTLAPQGGGKSNIPVEALAARKALNPFTKPF